MSRILITGVTGQDGSYLADKLLSEGHEVYGLVRGQRNPKLDWLLDNVPGVEVVTGDLLDQMSLVRAVDTAQPDYVYNLGAISAPALGWDQPTLMADVTGLGALRLLEAVRLVRPDARVLQASSIALHGPYGAAKQFAHLVAEDYRQRGVHVSCAVLGGHHSPRRGREFFARKVTGAVAAIHSGRYEHEKLTLGPLDRRQDWGWAEDFVLAEQLILQELPAGSYTVSTGDPHSNEEWVTAAFAAVGLDWRDHVTFNSSLGQPTDVAVLSAEPSWDLRALGWEPNLNFAGLARVMVEADL